MEHARTTNVLVVGDFARKAGISEAALKNLAPRARLMRTVLKSEVLHLLSTTPVDLILAVSGPLLLATEDLARAMNSLPLPIPILVVSRDHEFERPHRPGEVVEHMCAPVEIPELQARVSALLAARAQLIRIEGVSLPGFVQLVEMERRSCTLFVASAERRGVLCFVEGRLVDAHGPEHEGEAAALEIFGWSDTIFAFHRNVAASAPTIRRSLTELLLEAARLHDEDVRLLVRHEEFSTTPSDFDFSEEIFEPPANAPTSRLSRAVSTAVAAAATPAVAAPATPAAAAVATPAVAAAATPAVTPAAAAAVTPPVAPPDATPVVPHDAPHDATSVAPPAAAVAPHDATLVAPRDAPPTPAPREPEPEPALSQPAPAPALSQPALSDPPRPPPAPESAAPLPAAPEPAPDPDERPPPAQALDPPRPQPASAPPANPRQLTTDTIQIGEMTMANITKTIEEAMKIDGAIGVALADYESGLCLGTGGGGSRINIEVAAAGNCQVVKAKMNTMQELGIRGAIQDILITLDDQVHLIRPLRKYDNLFLYLAVDKAKGNLGLARHRLQKIETELVL